MSRNKGQRGEREFIALLQNVVDEVFGEEEYELKRNLSQTQDGGCDVHGLPEKLDLISVEIKFQETLHIDKWWIQTLDQTSLEKIPVLAFRQSRKKWRIITEGFLKGPYSCTRVEVTLEDFLEWYKRLLEDAKEYVF